MKKLLKKIGVIGLICAVLSPFINLPKVNAEEENCKHYLNQYLYYMPINLVEEWSSFTGTGFTTYASFLYDFPKVSSGQKLTVESVSEFELNSTGRLETYHAYVNKMGNKYKADVKTLEGIGAKTEQLFTSGQYESISAILHGQWGFEKSEGKPAGWVIETASSDFIATTIQGNFIASNLSVADLSITNGGAALVNGEFQGADAYTEDAKNFLQAIIDDINKDEKKLESEGYYYTEDGNTFFNFRVNRKFNKTNLNNLSFGDNENLPEGQWNIFSEDSTNIVGSYNALLNYNKAEQKFKDTTQGTLSVSDYEVEYTNQITHEMYAAKNGGNYCANLENNVKCYIKRTTTKPNFENDKPYKWPGIINVEYKVCGNSEAAKKWTLKYDDNVEDTSVTNMPSPISEEAEVGKSIKVTSTIPKRDGYTFSKWCTNSNGSGDCYTKGQEVKNTSTTELTLFAQWAKEGTEANGKTGVLSYVIGFAAVGLIAGTIYIVSKRKDLFKQI